GAKFTVPVKVVFGDFKGNVSLVALSLPTGMVMQPLTVSPGKETVQVNFDSKAVPPGTYTLIVRGQTLDPKAKLPPTKPGGPANLVQAVPPISVTVVPKQVAKLITPNNLKVGIGKEAELVVRVSRQFDYDGSFQVEVVVPPTAKEVTVAPVTLK